jgi:ABC-type multidrug transport system fused ATPase/permease subunit
MPSNTSSLAPLVVSHRWRLALTYCLTIAEQMCTLAYPALTGLAVDGLLKRGFVGLAALIAVWCLHLILSFIRQRYDTRVFTRIYAEVASAVVLRQRSAGEDISEVSARAELSREVVDFFEVEIPAISWNLVAIIGSFVMLLVYDIQAGLIAATVLLPLGLMSGWFARRAMRLNAGLNDQIEREVRTLERGSSFKVIRHFRLLGRWKVAISDAKSLAWFVTEAATIVALVFILIDFTAPGADVVTAGAIYAVIAYTHDYLGGLDDVPEVINSLARLKDIRARL